MRNSLPRVPFLLGRVQQELLAKRRAKLLERAQARRLYADEVLQKPEHSRTVPFAVVRKLPDILQIRLHCPPRPVVMPLLGNIAAGNAVPCCGTPRHLGTVLIPCPPSNRAIICCTCSAYRNLLCDNVQMASASSGDPQNERKLPPSVLSP